MKINSETSLYKYRATILVFKNITRFNNNIYYSYKEAVFNRSKNVVRSWICHLLAFAIGQPFALCLRFIIYSRRSILFSSRIVLKLNNIAWSTRMILCNCCNISFFFDICYSWIKLKMFKSKDRNIHVKKRDIKALYCKPFIVIM